jgi:chlorobactene glucosyltransferase
MKHAILGLLHISRLFALLYITIRLFRNLRFLNITRSNTVKPLKSAPKVTVIVPARNEEKHIETCITSLATQPYSNFEILVLNDQSTDKTGEYLDVLALKYPNIRVFHGEESPPTDWNGKSYACHRLSQYATGDWLLFTDADTIHQANSIEQGVLQAEKLGVDLLTLFPKQITQSWGERLMVSFIMDFLPLIGTDLKKQWEKQDNHIVANGQYLLIKAESYRQAGGHQAIGQALVDDFALTKHLQSNGYRTVMIDGIQLVSCRMYQDSQQVWRGFSKNLLLGLETSFSPIPMAFHFTNVFILPVLLFLLGFNRALLAFETLWLFSLRLMTNRHFTRSIWETLSTPISALGVITLSMNGLFLRKTLRSIQWKDRDYLI